LSAFEKRGQPAFGQGECFHDVLYVWDCAAGTGNLMAGLTNKYNIWASTLVGNTLLF